MPGVCLAATSSSTLPSSPASRRTEPSLQHLAFVPSRAAVQAVTTTCLRTATPWCMSRRSSRGTTTVTTRLSGSRSLLPVWVSVISLAGIAPSLCVPAMVAIVRLRAVLAATNARAG